jgi:starch-binding outer membrane protein, SusD/RagB family
MTTRDGWERLALTGLALGVIGLAGGCMDLEEDLVSNLSNQYISTPDGLTAAVNGAYSQLRGYWGREQNMALTDMGTDLWMNGDQVAAGGAQNWEYFNTYSSSMNGQDGRITNTWNPLYVMISRANAVLDQGVNAPVGGALTQAVKNSRLGEARFLRALAYFELVQAFGPVTLNLSSLAGISTEARRTPEDSVYLRIIADLDSAILLLPDVHPAAEWGRARKGAAQHLLAKVYLTRAYRAYGQGDADFQRALSLAGAVIQSGQFSLLPLYADLFCGRHGPNKPADPNRQGFCDTTTGSGFREQNEEVVFTIRYSTDPQQFATGFGNYLHLVYLGRYDGDPTNAAGLTRDIDNGRPFRRIRPSPYLIHLFDETRWAGGPGMSDILDTRFDGSFQTLWFATSAAPGGNASGPCPRCTSGEPIAVGDTALWMPGHAVTDELRRSRRYTILVPCTTSPTEDCGRDNIARRVYGWTYYPTLKKHQDNARGSIAEQDGGKDLVIMRLGETYLIAAEAAVGLRRAGEAADYVNVLRRRAASTAHKANPAILVAAPQMTLDFIMEERARELAGELNRWQDLVRPGADFFVRRVRDFNPEARRNVQPLHALRPIPQQQINGVTGAPYPQNPGY